MRKRVIVGFMASAACGVIGGYVVLDQTGSFGYGILAVLGAAVLGSALNALYLLPKADR